MSPASFYLWLVSAAMLLEAVGSKRGIKDDLEGDSRVQLVKTLVVRQGEARRWKVCGLSVAGLGLGWATVGHLSGKATYFRFQLQNMGLLFTLPSCAEQAEQAEQNLNNQTSAWRASLDSASPTSDDEDGTDACTCTCVHVYLHWARVHLPLHLP